MPDHHVKGQPAASTYVRENGCIKKDSNRDAPCIFLIVENFVAVSQLRTCFVKLSLTA